MYEEFEEDGVDQGSISFLRFAELRYANQEHSVEVEIGSGSVDAEAIETLTRNFHSEYETRTGLMRPSNS